MTSSSGRVPRASLDVLADLVRRHRDDARALAMAARWLGIRDGTWCGPEALGVAEVDGAAARLEVDATLLALAVGAWLVGRGTGVRQWGTTTVSSAERRGSAWLLERERAS